jgi:hypothetical protein
MPSRTTNARIAALATTLVAGVLAVFALRPSTSGTGSAAHVQPQAAEVRTQVIRRTVHIVRHERPPRGRGASSRRLAGSTATVRATASPVPRTGTSGSHPAAAGVATAVSAPRTRTSGASTRPTPSTRPAGAPVRTRSSGTSAAGTPSKSGSGAPVRTRTSGASTGGGSGGSGAVRTRTSGGSGGDGGDHGGGHDD